MTVKVPNVHFIFNTSRYNTLLELHIKLVKLDIYGVSLILKQNSFNEKYNVIMFIYLQEVHACKCNSLSVATSWRYRSWFRCTRTPQFRRLTSATEEAHYYDLACRLENRN